MRMNQNLSNGLVNHRRKMHEKSSMKVKFTCDKCNSVFEYKSNLTTHRKGCTGVQSADPDRKTCDKCNKSVSKSNFARHKKACNPEPQNDQGGRVQISRKAPCTYCGLEYTVQNLARHRRKCGGER